MDLAFALKMTRRQLLYSMDSLELSMWDAYLKEINRPPEPKLPEPEDPRILKEKLKNAFAVHKANPKKKSKKINAVSAD